jgi:hypothetical protein
MLLSPIPHTKIKAFRRSHKYPRLKSNKEEAVMETGRIDFTPLITKIDGATT